jgi:hypothetical protein
MSDQAKEQAKKVAQVAKAAVPKRGSIELFSPQYFVACTIGGMIGTETANLYIFMSLKDKKLTLGLLCSLRPYTYCCHTSRSCMYT